MALIRRPFYERKPIEEKADPKDEQGPLKDFFQESGVSLCLQFWQYEGQCVADGEEEKGKYQIRRGTALPGRMFQRAVDIIPAPRVVYKDHQGYGGAPKDIEGIKTLFQTESFSDES